MTFFRIEIRLDGPPRGKARPRNNPHSTFPYIDADARKYDQRLTDAAAREMAGSPPTAMPVYMFVEVRFPIAESWSKKKKQAALLGHIRPTKTPDADNSLKLADCLNQVVFVDDKQVVEAHVRKIYSEHPGLTIIVETIDPLAAFLLAALRQAEPNLFAEATA